MNRRILLALTTFVFTAIVSYFTGGCLGANLSLAAPVRMASAIQMANSGQTPGVPVPSGSTNLNASEAGQARLTAELSTLQSQETAIMESVPYKPISGYYRTSLPTSTACAVDGATGAAGSTVFIEMKPISKDSYDLAQRGPDTLFFAVLCGNRYVAWLKSTELAVPITAEEAATLLESEILLHDLRLRESACDIERAQLAVQATSLQSPQAGPQASS